MLIVLLCTEATCSFSLIEHSHSSPFMSYPCRCCWVDTSVMAAFVLKPFLSATPAACFISFSCRVQC
uniref:Oxidoreductase n=1 Tax=Rhizophora mucronata TaxID=61149 RepID=A0A2P2KG84_RHIMU